MGLKLFTVLVKLIAANQLLDTTYGTWKHKFDKTFL